MSSWSRELPIRELKQTRCRRRRELHLKMYLCNHFSIVQSHIFSKMSCNYPGIKLEPALQKYDDKTEHLSSYAHVVHTTAKQVHVVERTRTSSKCQKMKPARAKRAKIMVFIVKYANLWGFCCSRRRGCLSSPIGHFTSWKERERLRDVQKWKMHVQSVQNYVFYCHMQICDVLVAVVVVVA